MSARGIILIAIAFFGLVLNYSARPISEKLPLSELKIKIIALIIVLISVSTLMILGK